MCIWPCGFKNWYNSESQKMNFSEIRLVLFDVDGVLTDSSFLLALMEKSVNLLIAKD